jgi:hypothetical protein
MEHPGKRAPTVELCNDPRGFQPLALRQHYVGPYPIDPNLIRQGIPLDDRVDYQERIYAPLQGTPLPPGAVPSGTPPGAPPPTQQAPFMPPGMPAPADVPRVPVPAAPPPGNSINGAPIPESPPVAPAAGAVPAAPSAYAPNGTGPTVAYTPYDPRTGQYLTADGQLQQQTNMATGSAPKTWKDLMPT